MPIPPKTLAQLAERAKKLDGCVHLENSQIYEFPISTNIVAVVINPGSPSGHQGKDVRRNAELRQILAEGTQK